MTIELMDLPRIVEQQAQQITLLKKAILKLENRLQKTAVITKRVQGQTKRNQDELHHLIKQLGNRS